jgi:hypothetical protein
MANPQLNDGQREAAWTVVKDALKKIEELAAGDSDLVFAFRRKIGKEIQYAERSGPTARRKLKLAKRKAQNNKCKSCNEELPLRYVVLDRHEAKAGYTFENTDLICEPCDRKRQEERGFR